ncbi:hypothetical protein GDO86_003064 [Hymenochirus boettgeri]|uniref:Caspase family p20 domain-containing protein n=1 Tax=Hymenochirus boettgeri TaxID=247094 RepID=A0A8T2K7Z6_9PIPI|nr:hypothetical protein GDO86_003064 [Hymenochirus boettgeri]
MKSVIHCTDEEMKRICDFHGEMIYEVRKPKGRKRLALLICNESFTMLKERTGAQVDQNGMIKLLNELGYQVQLEKNLNSQNMLKVMKDFAAREEHLDSDSTFIVLMSHGEKDGICGTESHFSHTAKGQVVTDLLHFDHIFSTFNNINCAKLRNKPKVIIIQACRGHQDGRVLVSDDVALQGDDPMEDDAMKFVQRETDFVCFYSTTPGTVFICRKVADAYTRKKNIDKEILLVSRPLTYTVSVNRTYMYTEDILYNKNVFKRTKKKCLSLAPCSYFIIVFYHFKNGCALLRLRVLHFSPSQHRDLLYLK